MFGRDEDELMKGFTREQILGKDIKLTAATEPTNIIWENRHIKGVHYGSRVFSAFLVICFMLTITFWAIYVCKQFQIRNQEKWPVVDCKGLFDTYGTNDVSS